MGLGHQRKCTGSATLGGRSFRERLALALIHRQETRYAESWRDSPLIARLGNPFVTNAARTSATSGVLLAQGNAYYPSVTHIARVFDLVFQLGQDPKLRGLRRLWAPGDHPDYSRLDRWLPWAEFAPNDVVLLKSTPQWRLGIQYEADDVVGMLCWLAVDVRNYLVEACGICVDDMPGEVTRLAEAFGAKYCQAYPKLLGIQKDKERGDAARDLLGVFRELTRIHPIVDPQTGEVVRAIEDYLTFLSFLRIDECSNDDVVRDTLDEAAYHELWEFLCLDNLGLCLSSSSGDGFGGWRIAAVDVRNLPNRLRGNLEIKGRPGKKPNEIGLRDQFSEKKQYPDLVLYRAFPAETEGGAGGCIDYVRIVDFKHYDFAQVKKHIENGDGKIETLLPSTNGGVRDEKITDDIPKSRRYAETVYRYFQGNVPIFKDWSMGVALEFWLPGDEKANNDTKTNDTQYNVLLASNGIVIKGLPLARMIEATLKQYKLMARR